MTDALNQHLRRHPEAQKDGSAAPRGLDARHRLVGPRPHGALTVCGLCGVCLTPHANLQNAKRTRWLVASPSVTCVRSRLVATSRCGWRATSCTSLCRCSTRRSRRGYQSSRPGSRSRSRSSRPPRPPRSRRLGASRRHWCRAAISSRTSTASPASPTPSTRTSPASRSPTSMAGSCCTCPSARRTASSTPSTTSSRPTRAAWRPRSPRRASRSETMRSRSSTACPPLSWSQP
jgi:hypothetical protein